MKTGRITRLLALCPLLLTAGCFKLGPDYQRPATATAQRWLDDTRAAQTRQRPVQEHWWEVFNDPPLNQLIQQVYQQNLDIKKAAIRIQEARAQLGIARGSLFPQKQQLSMELFHDQLSEHSPYYQSTGEYAFTSFQTGFDAAWEIDIWGRFRRGIESAEAQLSASLLDYDDMLVSLTAETALAYVQFRTCEARLHWAGQNVELQTRSHRIAESRYKNGLGTELDMRQAEALRQTTVAEMANLEICSRQARHALSLLLGKPPTLLETELGTTGHIPVANGEIGLGIPADLLRRRPDIRREEFKAMAQSALVGVAKADLFPRFSLYGSIGTASGGFNGIDAFDVFSTQALAAKFGPTVSWPILQYGRLKNRVRVEDARLQEALVNYQDSVLKALKEVEDAWVAFRKTRERVEQLQTGVSASLRASELALKQYQNGLEDYTRVLNSQLLLMQQQDQFTASQGEAAKNLIAVYKALGGGWDIRKGQDPLPDDIRKTMQERTDWGDLLTPAQTTLPSGDTTQESVP